MYMKKKDLGIIVATLVVVAAGSISLIFSMTKMKGTVQDELSSSTQMTTSQGESLAMIDSTDPEGESLAMIDSTDFEDERAQEQEILESVMQEREENESQVEEQDQKEENLWQEIQSLLQEMAERGNEKAEVLALKTEKELEWERWWSNYSHGESLEYATTIWENEVNYVYEGQNVTVYDALSSKEEAEKNSKKIMDYIYDHVDEKLLVPNEIDKTEYVYRFTRQVSNADYVDYGVSLAKGEQEICSIGVHFEEEPVLDCFFINGNIKIPEGFDMENWCSTTAEKEAAYAKYLDQSKLIVGDVLGLSPIVEAQRNLESVVYFQVLQDIQTVIFGYVLEDGSYIRVFYNLIDESWKGFVLVDDPSSFFSSAL